MSPASRRKLGGGVSRDLERSRTGLFSFAIVVESKKKCERGYDLIYCASLAARAAVVIFTLFRFRVKGKGPRAREPIASERQFAKKKKKKKKESADSCLRGGAPAFCSRGEAEKVLL
jgi:hypothetical protein